PQLPEVDLRLLAGAGLEPDGRDGRPAALVPPRLHVPLHLEVAAAEAERPELPVQDGSIPADLRAAPGDELAKRLELLPASPALRAPAPQVPPALHGLLVHAQLAGDPLHPLAPLEPGQDLPHHVLLHHRPLRRSHWDRRRRYGKRLLLHTVPSSLGGGGNFRRRLRGEFYATDDRSCQVRAKGPPGWRLPTCAVPPCLHRSNGVVTGSASFGRRGRPRGTMRPGYPASAWRAPLSSRSCQVRAKGPPGWRLATCAVPP